MERSIYIFEDREPHITIPAHLFCFLNFLMNVGEKRPFSYMHAYFGHNRSGHEMLFGLPRLQHSSTFALHIYFVTLPACFPYVWIVKVLLFHFYTVSLFHSYSLYYFHIPGAVFGLKSAGAPQWSFLVVETNFGWW